MYDRDDRNATGSSNAQEQEQAGEQPDSTYQVLLDQITETIFVHGLVDFSMDNNISQEDVLEKLNKYLQLREYEIFLSCDFNLTSCTAADVVKMMIELSGCNSKSV